MEPHDQEYIHPEDRNNLLYWSRKFGVTHRQLVDAILDTGNLEARKVKEYLKRDSWIYHPVAGTAKFVRSSLDYIF